MLEMWQGISVLQLLVFTRAGENMNAQDIKTLIESDAAAAASAAIGADAECASRCSAIAPQVRQPVTAADVQYTASINGVWGTINLARESTQTPDQIKGVCITFLDWIKSGRAIDFDMPQVQSMLGGLIQSGLVTQAQADTLNAQGSVAQVITSDQVSAAMAASRSV